MLSDLCRAAGSMQRLAAALGLHERTVSRWVYHDRSPGGPARRLIWVIWCLCYDPEEQLEFRDLLAMLSSRRRGRRPPFGHS